jgi:hypothetical protein
VALPTLASLVFIAATNQIRHDMALEPRLWIFTLGLYLVTFILTFDHPRWYCLKLFAFLTLVKAQSEGLGMAYRHQYQAPDEVRNVRRNLHFIMTRDQAYLKAYPSVNREVRDEAGRFLRHEPQDQAGLRLWTDQFSSIAPIAK